MQIHRQLVGIIRANNLLVVAIFLLLFDSCILKTKKKEEFYLASLTINCDKRFKLEDSILNYNIIGRLNLSAIGCDTSKLYSTLKNIKKCDSIYYFNYLNYTYNFPALAECKYFHYRGNTNDSILSILSKITTLEGLYIESDNVAVFDRIITEDAPADESIVTNEVLKNKRFISSLMDVINKNIGLKYLALKGFEVRNIDLEKMTVQNMEVLDLSNNNLQKISLPPCNHLKRLLLQSNSFDTVPNGINLCDSIEYVDLRLNKISDSSFANYKFKLDI